MGFYVGSGVTSSICHGGYMCLDNGHSPV